MENEPNPDIGVEPHVKVLGALMAITIIVGALLWGLISVVENIMSHASKELVDVGDVVSMDEGRARETLADAGFVVIARYERNTQVEAGIVYAQHPDRHTRIPAGSRVEITVSLGDEGALMPEVVGDTSEGAAQFLGTYGLVVSSEQMAHHPFAQAGLVIRQIPRPGEAVRAGQAVELFISAGPADVVVPDVVRGAEDAAVTTLEQLGLGVTIRRVYSNTPAGWVTAQTPAAGTTVQPGTAVVISVSIGVRPTTTTQPPTTTTSTTTVQEGLESFEPQPPDSTTTTTTVDPDTATTTTGGGDT